MDLEPLIAKPATTPALEQPTRVRYGVTAFLAGMTFVLYLDRSCIGQAGPHIQSELGISHTKMGFVYGAFLLAYGLFEVPTGAWADRYGARGVLTRIVVWWSLFTALTGAAINFVTLLIIRFLFGAGEAGALPNAARVLSRWFPDSARGTAQGFIGTAAMLGGAMAPYTTAVLIEQVGWRWTFVCLGSVGVVWAIAFYSWFRDEPARHPSVNQSERLLIERGRSLADFDNSPHPAIPWHSILHSPNVWLLGAIMSCAASLLYLVISWYPSYLQQARGASDTESGVWTSVILAGGALGVLVGGWFNDWLIRRTGNRTWTRWSVGVGCFLIAGTSITASIPCSSIAASGLWMALASAAIHFQTPAWWGVIFQTSGRHTGAIFGLLNSMGLPGGIAAQVFLGWLVDYRTSLGYQGRACWEPGFYIFSAVFFTAAVLWLFVKPLDSIVDRDRSGQAAA